eukprot:TRINITY_DN23524_c0_g1_i1.p1 TRINITY_DN23524_c0_g1~~TRINITY_DN23524_c0_g1_i1.p1  ORF type:complete len:105 (-),score=5.70 TRINITY_DN23524_c0_g1_i1:595-909(-)
MFNDRDRSSAACTMHKAESAGNEAQVLCSSHQVSLATVLSSLCGHTISSLRTCSLTDAMRLGSRAIDHPTLHHQLPCTLQRIPTTHSTNTPASTLRCDAAMCSK